MAVNRLEQHNEAKYWIKSKCNKLKIKINKCNYISIIS